MRSVRQEIGGLGNLMFKEAYMIGQVLDGKIPDVYVQSEKYWAQHKDVIKQKFSVGIGPKIDKVSLHIRRGDYVGNTFYVNLWETDYYKKAIEKFPEDNFLVFCRDNQSWETDKADRQWCRDNLTPLLGDRWKLPSWYNTEDEDINLMANCKAHIMANSSFSWWAAYLGGGPTIAPKQWFTDGVSRIDLQTEWEQI